MKKFKELYLLRERGLARGRREKEREKKRVEKVKEQRAGSVDGPNVKFQIAELKKRGGEVEEKK